LLKILAFFHIGVKYWKSPEHFTRSSFPLIIKGIVLWIWSQKLTKISQPNLNQGIPPVQSRLHRPGGKTL
jgi:hypothetical protein